MSEKIEQEQAGNSGQAEGSAVNALVRLFFTSVCHCKNSNFQVDHSAKTEHDAVASFEKWCMDNDVLWAHLFHQQTGVGVKSFDSDIGLQDFYA